MEKKIKPKLNIMRKLFLIEHQWFHKIIEINRKYAKPRLKMNKFASIALLFLRFYLLFLIIIFIFKFWLVLQEGL